ncbi:FHA domain-containing protein [Salinibacterium sp. SWN1162]|uniref:FHA domain-containing protein n=1 Tax=Salinibacterium sp. SWN1162 TaxID=2792053 RepID=UPI0018CCF682|nr:FHA domain-containing protein [Salinibacterium sp. SWN1162]MBH0008856.1 FHA domain-containing protein [Salinibacterium sp. SWN1162]
MSVKYLYEPSTDAPWSAVVGEHQIVFVDSTDNHLLHALWSARSHGVQAAVELLSARGLAATPSFALVGWTADEADNASASVIVRGPVSVTITAHGGTETVNGARVSTWAERHFDDVLECELTVHEVRSSDPLPILDGVVRAGSITCIRDGSAPGRTVQSAPTAAPAPAPTAPAPVLAAAAPPAPPAETVVQLAGVSEATIADKPAVDDFSPPPAVGDNIPSDSSSAYDYLFGETVMRDVSAAAGVLDDDGADAPITPPEPIPLDDSEGDHDGLTIMTSDLLSHRAASSGARVVGAAAPLVESQPVLYLDVSTGSRELLTQPILVGRSPSVSKVSSGALPRLVTIPGDKDISRNHVQVAVEGGTVVVTDLHSRNGTLVVLPGRQPQRLRAGEPTAVIVGTVIDLGGDVTLVVGEAE